MKIFLVGVTQANLSPLFRRLITQKGSEDLIKLYLAGGRADTGYTARPSLEVRRMKIFFAGNTIFPLWIAPILTGEGKTMKIYQAGVPCGGRSADYYVKAVKEYKPYILESFYYADETTEKLLPYFGDFLLDSGAYTFIQNAKGEINWDEYIERYADFINRNKIEKFFELDIDKIIGYNKVKEYRKKLEKLTNRQCIPVWHKSRGYQEWLNLADEYSYIALGGIVVKEILEPQYKIFPQMIADAHKRGAKVHGLGFTNLKYLPKIHFDSVDSTSWTTGNRFGFVYRFDGKTMQKYLKPEGKRLADSKQVALINYCEWIKFQKYAEKNL